MDKNGCLAVYALLTLLFWSAAWVSDATGRSILRNMERENGWLATQEPGVMRWGRLSVLNHLRSADWKRSPAHRRRGLRLFLSEGVRWLSCAGLVVMVGWGHRLCAG